MADAETGADAPKKKKGKGKLLILLVVSLVVIGGGVGGGLYAAQAGIFGGGAEAAAGNLPRLLPKSEEKRAGAGGEGGEGGHGEGGGGESHGKATPKGEGGDQYASTYYQLEKEFTSNLQESVHFIQVGIAVSTAYDERVIENLRTHEIAVRSAVLLALGETTEEEVFTAPGKVALQKRLTASINAVLKQKEGFGGIGNVYFTNFIVQ